MLITIAYITIRKFPRFDWFAAGLARELRAVPEARGAQVVVIDGRLWSRDEESSRREELSSAVAGRFSFEHVSPKPTVWQGPTRLTKQDYFCAASTRNTAFALARGEHVIFLDDLSIVKPGWLKANFHAAEHRYVLAGSYSKRKKIEIDSEGMIVRSEDWPLGLDRRIEHTTQDPQRCGGEWLYGGTFSVPLEAALRVNGQDEQYDSIGGEDYDFGMRLERAGLPIWYTAEHGTIEDEDAHHAEAAMVRLDKPWPGSDGPYSSNRLLNLFRREGNRTWTAGNPFNLRELRARILAGEQFPVPTGPTHHWVDGQPLAEM